MIKVVCLNNAECSCESAVGDNQSCIKLKMRLLRDNTGTGEAFALVVGRRVGTPTATGNRGQVSSPLGQSPRFALREICKYNSTESVFDSAF
jgi:hypothetical protein